ncbi:hypothetical protein [Bradyrhizobium sp.]|uniref:hypothetical protein n=1 Tax=Bradyrhizobium sp. TaxID=376 RepID=UPI0039E44220
MNGYGTVEKIYRPLGIGVIRTSNGTTVIFTAGSVQGGDEGFQDLTEGDEVNYRLFEDRIETIGIARDVWKKHYGDK